jgi:hypothetical protein
MAFEAHTLSQIILLYFWFVLAGLLGFVVLIARFYQRFSGERTYYRWYLLPIIFYGAAALRYASIDQIAGDPLADILAGTAGISLLVLSVRLYRQMAAGRKPI